MNDGGRAFPNGQPLYTNLGMSLLDWFAGQALAAVNPDTLGWGTVGRPRDPWPEVAQNCYNAAAAMIAERERRMKE